VQQNASLQEIACIGVAVTKHEAHPAWRNRSAFDRDKHKGHRKAPLIPAPVIVSVLPGLFNDIALMLEEWKVLPSPRLE
jgi:hypothetical protein